MLHENEIFPKYFATVSEDAESRNNNFENNYKLHQPFRESKPILIELVNLQTW